MRQQSRLSNRVRQFPGSLSSEPLSVTGSSVSDRAADAREHAHELVATSRDLRARRREFRTRLSQEGWPRFFTVHGEIDGRFVQASWYRTLLGASDELMARAQLIVSVGDHFGEHGSGSHVIASLDEPLPALLTFIRACDQTHKVVFGPSGITTQPPTLLAEGILYD